MRQMHGRATFDLLRTGYSSDNPTTISHHRI